MKFRELDIAGAFVVDLTPISDDRGFFARAFCSDEFREHGLPASFAQCNISYNLRRGTMRGMHFNAPPHEEGKLVRCTSGAIHDVIVDMREGSSTYRRWIGVDLDDRNRTAIYIPPGLAHGFMTLRDETEVFYQMTSSYVPGFERGVRWDDPAIGIEWPLPVSVISGRDATFPLLDA